MSTSEKSKARSRLDDAMLDEACRELASAVTGKSGFNAFHSARESTVTAMAQILSFLNQKPVDIPPEKDPVEYITAERNISFRTVCLEGAWYKNAVGPYLGETVDGQTVAILPKRGGYVFFDEKSGKNIRLNKKTASLLCKEATYFYIPLPNGKIGIKDLYSYMLKALSAWDYILVIGATAMASIIAMVVPAMTKLIFSGLIPSKNYQLILPIFFLMLSATLSSLVIQMIRSQSVSVVNVRAGSALQAAAMARVMSMPTGFFRDYSSGELASRLGSIDRLTTATVNAVVSSGLTGIFSLVYFFQIYAYAPTLAFPAVAVLILQTALSFVSVAVGVKRANKRLQKESKLSGLLMSILNGIQKIRFSGAEKRVFSKWAGQYKEVAELNYRIPKILLYNRAISAFISLVGLAVIYYTASASDVTQANYMAFNSAYGMVAGAFTALTGIVSTIAEFGPMLNMMKPILETEPEIEPGKLIPDSLEGGISISHVSFRYNKNGPMILDDICLDVRPGEYVGIVGATGCGKSTLMRLMLGFEKPEQGAVYYDSHDLATLNLRGLRRKIGTVLQNGQLIQGSIFANLMICHPELTEDEAWEALEMAALADDVRKMPMKLNTVLSENGGGISGGQKQRLLIARALVRKPRIVFMDEATSALDNVAQAHTVKALDSLNCTRVVIAHRLSTIQNCSRIIMLEDGKIVEEGTYQQLIDLEGKFAALVKRQRLDT